MLSPRVCVLGLLFARLRCQTGDSARCQLLNLEDTWAEAARSSRVTSLPSASHASLPARCGLPLHPAAGPAPPAQVSDSGYRALSPSRRGALEQRRTEHLFPSPERGREGKLEGMTSQEAAQAGIPGFKLGGSDALFGRPCFTRPELQEPSASPVSSSSPAPGSAPENIRAVLVLCCCYCAPNSCKV